MKPKVPLCSSPSIPMYSPRMNRLSLSKFTVFDFHVSVFQAVPVPWTAATPVVPR